MPPRIKGSKDHRGGELTSGRTYTVEGLIKDDDLQVFIPDVAIDDRMELYDCTRAEALDYIMWEHYLRVNPDASDVPEPFKTKVSNVHKGKFPEAYLRRRRETSV